MGLAKLVKNRISSEWKETFNYNVEQIEREQERNQTSHKATNKRIDNLVLNSGGISPNEVTDARTDTKGTIFETLKARIDNGETLTIEELKDVNEKLKKQKEEITQLNDIIKELYSGEGSNVDIYVSVDRGNDNTADGTEVKPFKTIQGAVNGIPFLSSTRYFVNVEPGVYLEDVVVSGVIANGVVIQGTNKDVVDAKKEDTGVFVRSIQFHTCQAYCATRGITQTDVQNSGGYFIHFVGCVYGAVDNCRAVTNTKGVVGPNFRWEQYRCFVWDRTQGNIYGARISTQAYAIVSLYTGMVRVTNDVFGGSNLICYVAYGSFILKGKDNGLTGGQESTTNYGGQVFSS